MKTSLLPVSTCKVSWLGHLAITHLISRPQDHHISDVLRWKQGKENCQSIISVLQAASSHYQHTYSIWHYPSHSLIFVPSHCYDLLIRLRCLFYIKISFFPRETYFWFLCSEIFHSERIRLALSSEVNHKRFENWLAGVFFTPSFFNLLFLPLPQKVRIPTSQVLLVSSMKQGSPHFLFSELWPSRFTTVLTARHFRPELFCPSILQASEDWVEKIWFLTGDIMTMLILLFSVFMVTVNMRILPYWYRWWCWIVGLEERWELSHRAEPREPSQKTWVLTFWGWSKGRG